MNERTRIGPIEVPDNPVPPGGVFRWLQREGATRLRYALWHGSVANGTATLRGSVVIVPGRTEFIEKYFEVISELIERGFAVAILDVRGQGLSSRALPDRRKGHVDDFEDYAGDLDAWMTQVVAPELPPPFTLLAHSMGGNIALRHLQRQGGVFDRAVLTSPMTGLRFDPLLPSIVEMMVRTGILFLGKHADLPAGARSDPLVERFEHNVVTRDRRRFHRTLSLLQSEPKLALGPPTLGWLDAAMKSVRYVMMPRNAQSISVPVLLVSAAHDRIVDIRSHAKLAALLPHCEWLTIDRSEHEILIETDDKRAQFWAAFDRFVGL
ncbi:MAG: alpha/beta hydrolase [Alphaproteobacteria bacterium]|nr:MAG: alpha/beta hydrolase [Alphaproteobacteria bacterium]